MIKHIGDSRIYRVKGSAEQLTEDHSWVAVQVKNGRMSAEEAKHHDSRHVLTQCLGVNDKIMPYVSYGSLSGSDQILLCSDGFYTMVEEEQWLKYFSLPKTKSQDLQATANTLVDLANHSGGYDNITVVLFANMENEKQSWSSRFKAWMNVK